MCNLMIIWCASNCNPNPNQNPNGVLVQCGVLASVSSLHNQPIHGENAAT